MREQTVQNECAQRPKYDGEYPIDPRCQPTNQQPCAQATNATHTQKQHSKYMSATVQYVSPEVEGEAERRQRSIHKLNGVVRLDRRQHVIDILRYNITAARETRHAPLAARITFDPHESKSTDRHGDFSHVHLLVTSSLR